MPTLGGALADLEGVAEAYSVTGEWDFVAIVRVPRHEQLADVITGQLCSSPAWRARRRSWPSRRSPSTTSRRCSRSGSDVGRRCHGGRPVPRPPRRRRPAASLAAAALPAGALAGCGGGDGAGASAAAPAPAPARTAPATDHRPRRPTAPAPTATAPATADPAGHAHDRRRLAGDAPGGAGDEQPIRVPAAFSLAGDQVTPGKVTVPAFLSVELAFKAADGRAHEVLVRTPDPPRLAVPASGTATKVIAGCAPGLPHRGRRQAHQRRPGRRRRRRPLTPARNWPAGQFPGTVAA